jgi:phosphinothricin acetyltransferase
VIRAATPQDAGWIAAIWNAMIADTLFTYTTEPKTEGAIAEMIETRPVFVLADQTGFATYGPFRSGPGYAATVEHSILLDTSAQGRGQGRALMQTLMKHARGQEHHVMVAGISSANPNAVAFHAALGFETVAQMPEVGRKNDQWLDLILMQKLLG